MSNEKRAVSSEKAKIQNFTDINAWKEGHNLYVSIHQATKLFPKDELFGLTNQIRRAALSITSNIAEGFGRSRDQDKVHFYVMARGSLYEVQNQLLAARDTGMLSQAEFDDLFNHSKIVQRILIGFINATRKRIVK